MEDIVIAGAGLAGLATALGLHRQATPLHNSAICWPVLLAAVAVLRAPATASGGQCRSMHADCRADGRAGGLVSCRKGVRCLVLESSPALRASGFAFTTWTNAFRALDALGVGDKIREHHLLYER